MRHALWFAALAVLAFGLATCTQRRSARPARSFGTPPAKQVRKPRRRKPRHRAHDHRHGKHPHRRSPHHHHAHLHPHVEGPNGHHHPW